MDKLMKEAPQSFRGRMFRQDTVRPKEHRILVLKTGIAGITHHVETGEEREALEAAKPGTELMLFREPENEYDCWAIAVHLTEEDKLGFITRFKNETIARLMDAGKRFIAVLDDPETDPIAKQITEKEMRRNRRAGTENMAFPISIYMIEEV